MASRTWCFRLARISTMTALAVSAACALNPATGQRQLALVSEAQEIEMGRQAARDVEQTIGLVDDKPLQDYVARVGGRLAQASERPKLPWSFHVVDDPTPNAFALPGGPIFVTRGLMNLMDSEAELASVLGHEIGHVTARHAVSMISRQQLAQLGLGLGGAIYPELQPYSSALGAGLDLLFLKYGRDAERQADELGFRYANREDYDLDAMADVFASLERTSELEEQTTLPSWLATHPGPEERIEHVHKMLAATPSAREGRVARAEYLERIDHLVYGENPRHGFFRDGRFYHPDLRFEIAVPKGWDARNLPNAVVAVDPGQAAAVELTVAGGTPDEASRRFLAQNGIQGLDQSRETVNGIPARVALFDAQTNQGVIRGMVAHLAHRGRTFQIVAYAAAGRFGDYRNTFDGVIRSFDTVTDPKILDVQPKRMDIVRLDRAMTLGQFSESHESSVPARVLAILNQVPGEASQLQAGSLVKRVIG